MSGGHFDYAYWKTAQFSEQLQQALLEEYMPLSEETRAILVQEVRRINKQAEVMRAIEWFYSGDISEEEMMQRIKENE